MRVTARSKAAVCIVIACMYGLVGCGRLTRPKTYTARTTLMESLASSSTATPASLGNLAQVALSVRVIDAVMKKLPSAGVTITRKELLSSAKASAVPNTNLVAIEVTRLDPSEAKVIATLISDELKAAYTQVRSVAPADSVKFAEAVVEQSRVELVRSQGLLRRYKEEVAPKPDDAKQKALQADVKKAVDVYSKAKKQLDEARTQQGQAKNASALKTIDPVYVAPTK